MKLVHTKPVSYIFHSVHIHSEQAQTRAPTLSSYSPDSPYMEKTSDVAVMAILNLYLFRAFKSHDS